MREAYDADGVAGKEYPDSGSDARFKVADLIENSRCGFAAGVG